MRSYYNEHDPKAAAWLRQLIADGLITPGDVDERSITAVRADDVRGYDRVHLFAGIGGWELALALAGWGDRPIWTGSCPCQPFSTAGKRQGHADERHLWPEFYRLIAECHPGIVVGEQVEGAVRLGWLDLVRADLAREGYAFGATVLGAHSVGAPHQRQRLFWVAHTSNDGHAAAERWRCLGASEDQGRLLEPAGTRPTLPVADTERGAAERRGYDMGESAGGVSGTPRERQRVRPDAGPVGPTLGLGDPGSEGLQERRSDGRISGEAMGAYEGKGAQCPGASSHPWSAPVWLACRDGKWRPTAPGIHPLVGPVDDPAGPRHEPARVGQPGEPEGRKCLSRMGCENDGTGQTEPGLLGVADGVPPELVPGGDPGAPDPESITPEASSEARVMRLRGYGNAINVYTAALFLDAVMEVTP